MTRRLSRSIRTAAVVAAVVIPAGAAHAASIWTPVATGTTDTISALDYQSPTRLWFATTNGLIARWNGSSFVAALSAPGENFTDLALAPGSGTYGYAVTSSGHLWQTHDGGVTWSQLGGLTTHADCSATAVAPVSELNAVVWANGSTAYLLGNDSTLQKSTAANSATPSFTEIDKVGSGTCQAQGQTFTRNLTDAAFLPANPLFGFAIAQDFGELYQTSNGYSSGTALKQVINEYTGNPRIAIDGANPNRLWAVDHAAGGTGCGILCFAYSIDGGQTFANPQFPNDPQPSVGLYDVSSQGGVEVAAGTGGEIFTSPDGVSFYLQRADGALAAENWRAEGAFDAQHAAVAGQGGALALTAQANTIPDIVAPTGTIAGPATVTSGQSVTYTANVADNPGGSGIDPGGYTWSAPGVAPQHGASAGFVFPRGTGTTTITLTFSDTAGNQATATLNVTVQDAATPPPSGASPRTLSTGGASVTFYRVVTVSGRNGRFVPLVVSAKQGRRFSVSIVSAKSRRRVASKTVVLRHGGRRTIHLGLASKAGLGSYQVVVRVLRLNGHGVGRRLKVTIRVV